MTDRQGYVNTTKVLFRPIKRLKLIGAQFPERSANFYSCFQVRTMGRFKMAATMFNDVIYRHGP